MEKNSVLNKVSVIVFAFVFLVINIVLQVTRPISNLDEIWNYNLANQMLNGLIPYKDISMIITPASSFFMAIGLKLVANSLLVYRVIAGFFITALLIISYKILEKLTKNKLFSLLAVFIIELIFYDFFTYDYNFLIPFLVKFTEQTKDIHMPEKLEAELPQILGWAIQGCVELNQKHNGVIVKPKCLEEALSSYKKDMDTINLYISSNCQNFPG